MIALKVSFFMGWVMAHFSIVSSGLTVALLAIASPALSQTQPMAAAAPPKIFQDVVQCRAITDSAERLACFDRTVGTLEAAQQSKDLYVADKEAVREARRGLFGFSLPKMRIFGDDDMEKDVDSIETTIVAAVPAQKGYIFTLKDGARWMQTDGAYMDKPKAGAKIRIKRAALGSFFATIEKSPGVRVERLNN